MSADADPDADPDAESESGDLLDIGEDAEFYECEDGSLASDDDSFYDSCDVNDEWSDIPDLRPRAQDNNFPPSSSKRLQTQGFVRASNNWIQRGEGNSMGAVYVGSEPSM